MTDPALAHDATQLALLMERPEWHTFTRYVDEMRANALSRFADPASPDQNTHHWRGVYTALIDVLALPQSVIDAERRSRATPAVAPPVRIPTAKRPPEKFIELPR